MREALMSEGHAATADAAVDALSLSDVSSGNGAISVVKSVTLSVRPGEIVAVLGKNGMGKSTLLKTILGLVALSGGAIHVGGADRASLTPARMIAWGLSYVPQEQPLFQDLTIGDNLRLAVRRNVEFSQALERAIAYFPFLKDRLKQRAGTLSGGEQKMLILARALMLRPRLLLIDEISEGLQPSVVERIASVLGDERAKDGTAMLVIEQNLDFALSIADRWVVLKLGEIDEEGECDPGARARVLKHLRL
jgi:ABC-type branched-subunit amino acid transport system ATPase component